MAAIKALPRLISDFKTVLRFEAQDINWSKLDFTTHSDAFGYSLLENKVKTGGKVLFWTDEQHCAEYGSAVLGSLKAGCLVRHVGETYNLRSQANIKEILLRENPDILVFSPNQLIDSKKKADIITEQFPELLGSSYGKPLKLKEVKNLKFIVQTGFYAKPGMVKFRDFLFYRNRRFSKLPDLELKASVLEELNKRTNNVITPSEHDKVFFVSGFHRIDFFSTALINASMGTLTNFISLKKLEESNLDFMEFYRSDDITVCAEEVHKDKVKQALSNYNVKLISF